MTGPRHICAVIPTFNNGGTVADVVRGVLGQGLPVIVVDDGSSDATAAMADGYAAKDARFRVIHKPNGGVASARQAGLDAARGVFTIHADADDWIDRELLEKLVETAGAEQADMVICDFHMAYPARVLHMREEYVSQRPKSLEPVRVLGEMLYDLHGSLCNKLIRRSRLEEYRIRLVEGMDKCEDKYVVLRLLAHPIKVSYVSGVYYHYDMTQNDVSICNAGFSATDLMRPLDMIAAYTDITPVRYDWDRAIFRIAFQYVYGPSSLCPDYRAVFGKHWRSILRAKNLPLRGKLMIMLRICGINPPFEAMKKAWGRRRVK